MKWFKADLHIHSVLSPCGSLEMSPKSVMNYAKKEELDIIAITDHNSMANFSSYKSVADRYDITLLCGMEVQSSEEIHTIALFDDISKAKEFELLLYDSLLPIENDSDYFGDQVMIDEHENIIGFEKRALINSSIWSFDETLQKIFDYEGFAFPAHVDADTYSVIAQLGFIPENDNILAVGVTAKCILKDVIDSYPYLKKYALIKNSDAHYLKDIGSGFTHFFLKEPTIEQIKLACLEKQNKIKYN